MKNSILAVCLLALACACGSGDSDTDDNDGVGGVDGGGGGEPISDSQNFCDVMSEAACNKLVTCFTEQERLDRGMPRDKAMCLELEEGSCTPETVCEPGQTYDPAQAGNCVAEYEATSCEDIRSPEAAPGPACSAVCQ